MRHGFKKLVVFVPTIVIITIMGIFLVSFANERKYIEDAYAVNNSGEIQAASIEIHSEEDYLEFASSVNDGNNYENWEVILCSDLDFSSYDHVDSIGIEGKRTRKFLGTFEGNGHKISGVEMVRSEGYAGLFVNLGGIVKNLRVEDCEFSGQVCGAIASDTTGASILNCYVDAKCDGNTVGDIVGILNGNIYNCVSATGSFAAEENEGEVSNCYRIGEEDVSALNRNLYHVSGRYEDVSFCMWEAADEGILSEKKADLIESITAKMVVHGEDLSLSGYYSVNKGQWCITLPSNYSDLDMPLEIKTSMGESMNFSRKASEESVSFVWNNMNCSIAFLCADNVNSIYITLEDQKTLEQIHASKDEIATGRMMIFDPEGNRSYVPVKEFYGHGNGSWVAAKRSYNIQLESAIDLLDMGASDDFVFLAGYRDDSLMSYVATTEMVQEMGYAYAPEFRLVNLYVEGEYVGVYFLTEKVELDTNRIDIDSVYRKTKELNGAGLELFRYCGWEDEDTEAERYYYNVNKNPDDITGGYLLEADVEDYAADDSRFVSERGLQFTLKRARYTSKEQMNYIADFWQEFEDALFSADGCNDLGKHYSEYIDMESFAMQWLIYELEEESSLNSSIYFYKESDVTGDGLLHACYPWDMEHSYVTDRDLNLLWMDWFDQFHGYWKGLYAHEDFRKEVYRVWKEKFVPAINKMIAEESVEYDSGLKNLSWYQKNSKEIFELENSRWEAVNPWERCDEIRIFLAIRMEVLSRIFE